MPSGVKVYQIKDFVRFSESGEIDLDRSMQLVHELAAVTNFNSDHNILIDLRETKVSFASMKEAMTITIELIQCMPPDFKNKIANVVPNDTDRKALAKKFEICMNIQGIDYKFFTDFEDAIEWLADSKKLK